MPAALRRRVPRLEDYGLSPELGFLGPELPLGSLTDAYYSKWEAVVRNLQALLLSRRLRSVVDALPILTTENLRCEGEWRRAYSVLAFIVHAYIWGGDGPAAVIPPSISVPFLSTCAHFDLPPVATYAAVVLWNFKPLFDAEPVDNLENLSTLNTFTGSLDESWFYLISVAIEARCAPIIPIMLQAIDLAHESDEAGVTASLQAFAERLETVGSLLLRVYDSCDPHVFYYRIRPFLAGSKNMEDAGLPKGVMFEDGSGTRSFVQHSGGSNAQSSLLQFFDIILGVEHRPTGVTGAEPTTECAAKGPPPPHTHNFIMDMRRYMPKQHRLFLEHVGEIANIREFVEARRSNNVLATSYDACLAMLRDFRDKHLQIVSRYVVLKSRESRSQSRSLSPRNAPKFGLAARPTGGDRAKRQPKGTGGTALVQFLKQARDESAEPAMLTWARRLLMSAPQVAGKYAALGTVNEHANGQVEITGLAGEWSVDDNDTEGGGICHW